MSRWTDAYNTHPLHADWAAINEALLVGKVPKEADPTAGMELARLRKLVDYIDGIFRGIDPELVGPSLLQNAYSYVNALLGEINSFFANGNVGHLVNSNANADAIMGIMSQPLAAPFGITSGSILKASNAYQNTLVKSAEEYREKMSRLYGESEKKVLTLAEALMRSNETISKLDIRISNMETELPSLLTGFNTAFQTSETQRLDRFDKAVLTNQGKFDKQFSDTSEKQIAAILVMSDYQDQAGKVLGSVIDTAQAGAYATYANEQKQSANLYRRLAISLMIFAALVLFLPEISAFAKIASGYSVDWQKALYRLPFSLILFAPAVYLAKESSKHRVNEVLNRRRQHILTTIGPYLALLDDKQAEEIRTEVAKSIFSDGPQVTDDKSSDAGNMVAQITNLVTTIFRNKP